MADRQQDCTRTRYCAIRQLLQNDRRAWHDWSNRERIVGLHEFISSSLVSSKEWVARIMKRVLIVSPYYPPSKLPPTLRVKNCVNHLEKFGWYPVVLTVKPQYYEEELDDELSRLIFKNPEIHSVKAFPTSLTRKFGIGDLGFRAYFQLRNRVARICRSGTVSAMLMLSPPAIWPIGCEIKKKQGVPFVVDYNDPWVSSYGEQASMLDKAYWIHRINRRLEPYVLSHADHLIGVSQGTFEFLKVRYPYLKYEKFTEIPYGGEPLDFAYLDSQSGQELLPKDGKLRLVYVGALGHDVHDILRSLMNGLKEVRKRRPAMYRRLRLCFFGSTYAQKIRPESYVATQIARECDVDDIVFEHPARVSYLDALRILRSSDIILALSLTKSPHYTASKIYPCILANRPILSIFHEKSLSVDVLRKMGADSIITFSKRKPVSHCVDEIASEIVRLVSEDSKPRAPIAFEAFKAHTAQHMTERLAAVLDLVAG